ncbi:hypothetical protein DMI70_07180 [Escherichia coli]|nr:hypothetical protein [Escherichia coli]
MVLVRWLKAVTHGRDGNGLFIQPYAKLSALTLEGVDYQLNGVDVHSDSYNSVLGEAGTRVGYDFAVGNATVKPYLNLAALNEFSDGNKVRLGDESVNASIDGAAFRVGAGVQADITKTWGAYASLDYTKGDDIENPLQGVVGINVTGKNKAVRFPCRSCYTLRAAVCCLQI